MRAEIQRLQNELGITAIYVTHDQEEAMTMGDRIVVLRDGELQQVGSPRDVYEHPANRFVAGFIGSPSMNFLEVEFTGDGTLTDGRNFDYRLSEEYVDGLDVEPGETLVAGIRPEHVRPADGGGQTVEVAEPVGSDNYLYLDVGEEFVARVDTDVNPEPGETIAVTFDEDMLRLFDDETGAILGYGALGVDAPEVRP
jgi:multiple sugar transport system ATP-binding protein